MPEPSLPPPPPPVFDSEAQTRGAGGPLSFPDEPESSGSWLGALLILIILFYFFAPAAWKNWVREQWEKLPVEVSVKVKSLPVTTPPVGGPPPPAEGQPPLRELPAPSPEETPINR